VSFELIGEIAPRTDTTDVRGHHMPLIDSSRAREKPVVSVRLLDGFELLVGDQSVRVIPSSQRLLAYLALHGGSVTRTTLAATLWPTAPDRRAAACLRSALWRLVKPPHALIETRQETLRIGRAVEVDVTTVRRFVADVTGQTVSAPDVAMSVTSLSADLLPGWTDHWVVAERDWFRQVCLRALEMLSERFRTRGDHFRAHETAVAAVRGDPLRESAHRRLIELHLADGNPAAALRQYKSYQSILYAELGLSPSPEIRRLVEPVFSTRPA
jgi:DNA-binding SARP family transcriptional activator